jgi:hypothetical protein
MEFKQEVLDLRVQQRFAAKHTQLFKMDIVFLDVPNEAVDLILRHLRVFQIGQKGKIAVTVAMVAQQIAPVGYFELYDAHFPAHWRQIHYMFLGAFKDAMQPVMLVNGFLLWGQIVPPQNST